MSPVTQPMLAVRWYDVHWAGVQRRMVFGRGRTCDFTVTSGRISREQCSVEWDGQQYLLTDLNSSAGCWLRDAGTKLRSGVGHPVPDGMAIRANAEPIDFLVMPVAAWLARPQVPTYFPVVTQLPSGLSPDLVEHAFTAAFSEAPDRATDVGRALTPEYATCFARACADFVTPWALLAQHALDGSSEGVAKYHRWLARLPELVQVVAGPADATVVDGRLDALWRATRDQDLVEMGLLLAGVAQGSLGEQLEGFVRLTGRAAPRPPAPSSDARTDPEE